jgi:hypothetical protein
MELTYTIDIDDEPENGSCDGLPESVEQFIVPNASFKASECNYVLCNYGEIVNAHTYLATRFYNKRYNKRDRARLFLMFANVRACGQEIMDDLEKEADVIIMPDLRSIFDVCAFTFKVFELDVAKARILYNDFLWNRALQSSYDSDIKKSKNYDIVTDHMLKVASIYGELKSDVTRFDDITSFFGISDLEGLVLAAAIAKYRSKIAHLSPVSGRSAKRKIKKRVRKAREYEQLFIRYYGHIVNLLKHHATNYNNHDKE